MEAKDRKQEHTGSYYAATVNEVTDYAPLQGSVSADVCVVGAGFTGVATTLTLAERGYSVALVEANRVGWGASGRNGGQLINGMNGHEKIVKKHGPGHRRHPVGSRLAGPRDHLRASREVRHRLRPETRLRRCGSQGQAGR